METAVPTSLELQGSGELTPLGKRIEMLRIERGVSKQALATAARVSRQQLWRVLAGKSELTLGLRLRLAEALRVDAQQLTPDAAATGSIFGAADTRTSSTTAPSAFHMPDATAAPATFAAFAGQPDHLRALLALCPSCIEGTALKRAVLDAVETIAMTRELPLPSEFFDLRRAVLSREL